MSMKHSSFAVASLTLVAVLFVGVEHAYALTITVTPAPPIIVDYGGSTSFTWSASGSGTVDCYMNYVNGVIPPVTSKPAGGSLGSSGNRTENPINAYADRGITCFDSVTSASRGVDIYPRPIITSVSSGLVTRSTPHTSSDDTIDYDWSSVGAESCSSPGPGNACQTGGEPCVGPLIKTGGSAICAIYNQYSCPANVSAGMFQATNGSTGTNWGPQCQNSWGKTSAFQNYYAPHCGDSFCDSAPSSHSGGFPLSRVEDSVNCPADCGRAACSGRLQRTTSKCSRISCSRQCSSGQLAVLLFVCRYSSQV